jgi:hypothetical protein
MTALLTRLNQLGDQRRLRLLSSQSVGIPVVMSVVLLGFLFGTTSTTAQVMMTSALSMTIALVLFSILAMEHPFAGITRVEPDAFNQVENIFDVWRR